MEKTDVENQEMSAGAAAETQATNGQAQQPATDDAQLFDRVQAVIDEVRPYIQSDGGDVELLKVEDQIVYVRLNGACIGCPSSMMTLRAALKRAFAKKSRRLNPSRWFS